MSNASVQVIVFDIAPELYTVDVDALAKLDRFITRASRHVNEDLAGDTYDELVAYLVAHRFTMAVIASAGGVMPIGGALLSEKVSKTAYTYASRGTHDGDNWETKYGRQFDSMMKTMLPYGMMVLSD